MQGFQKVVGHQEIITHLQNAISMNKVSHAYLFGGESGSGKKMMASLFAMTLQCEKHGVEPCMECPSCKKAQSQNHPDIIYVKHEKPNTISIDEIREQLINDVMIKPYSSPYKIYHRRGAEADTSGAERAAEDDRGAAGLRSCHASGRQPGCAASDDFVTLRAVKFKTSGRPACERLSDERNACAGLPGRG